MGISIVWCSIARANQALAEVHDSGCSDLHKQASRRDGHIEAIPADVDRMSDEAIYRWAADTAFHPGAYDAGEMPDLSIAPCVRKGRKATAAKETAIMATTTKQCPGVKDGDQVIIPAHDAPADVATFGANAARKDGLGRSCKACWARYTQVLKARKAGAAPAADAADAKPARVSPKRAGTEVVDHDLVATYGDAKGWTTEVIETKAGLTRFALPTEVDTVATDEGQAALEIVAKARDAARKRKARQAAKAEPVATPA